MPKLILGPLLRWVGGTQATVGVEAGAPDGTVWGWDEPGPAAAVP